MAQLVVRNLEDEAKERLQRRARRNGLSLEEEVREIRRKEAWTEEPPGDLLGTRIARRFTGVGRVQIAGIVSAQRVPDTSPGKESEERRMKLKVIVRDAAERRYWAEVPAIPERPRGV